jgi:hypothetical protein
LGLSDLLPHCIFPPYLARDGLLPDVPLRLTLPVWARGHAQGSKTQKGSLAETQRARDDLAIFIWAGLTQFRAPEKYNHRFGGGRKAAAAAAARASVAARAAARDGNAGGGSAAAAPAAGAPVVVPMLSQTSPITVATSRSATVPLNIRMNLAHNLESPPTVPSGRHALALAAASATPTAIEGMDIMGSVMTPQLASKIAVASGQQASGLGQSATYATLGTARGAIERGDDLGVALTSARGHVRRFDSQELLHSTLSQVRTLRGFQSLE